MAEITIDDVPAAPEYPKFEGAKQKMLDYVRGKATPGNAAIAAGVDDNWKSDTAFAAAINRAHAHNICEAESAAHNQITSKKPLSSGLRFYLEAQGGWRTKFGDDGFAQDITIKVKPIDGFVPPEFDGKPEAENLARPEIRTNEVARAEAEKSKSED